MLVRYDMRQLPLQQIRQLCCVPFGTCQFSAKRVPRHAFSLQRNFARQPTLRTVAQARKSLLMRELASGRAEAQEDEDDNVLPSGTKPGAA